MNPRASQLISDLALLPHPEGGHYRQVYQSASRVTPADGRPDRATLTTIYFLLGAGEVSRWHTVASDEVWHFYGGATLELWTMSETFEDLAVHHLGPLADSAAPVHVVPAGMWQAARTTGEYTLVGCTVAPGFDFADFTLLTDLPAASARLGSVHPEASSLI